MAFGCNKQYLELNSITITIKTFSHMFFLNLIICQFPPTTQLSLIIQQQTGVGESQHVLPPNHIKLFKSIYLDCCLCCVRRQGIANASRFGSYSCERGEMYHLSHQNSRASFAAQALEHKQVCDWSVVWLWAHI